MTPFIIIFALATLSATDDKAPISPHPCLLVRPTGGVETAFGNVGGRYEYLDSVNLKDAKIKYSKHDIEQLQHRGVHIVVVQRDAKRDELKQARESCQ